jgi:hypothetical protein
MKRKVEQAVNAISDSLKSWSSVNTITVLQGAEDLYDPYFFLSFDVYFEGSIPGVEERQAAFDYAGAFESSTFGSKDRFLVENIPVRIEYKDKERFQRIVEVSKNRNESYRDTGTYMFYRMQESELLFERSAWLPGMREELRSLGDDFWSELRGVFQTRMEHQLSDLSAGVFRNDPLFYLSSSAAFIRSVCSVLFAVNRAFEPGGRLLAERTLALTQLPEQFAGRFEAYLKAENHPERRRELAELMAKSIIRLP